MRTGYSTSRRSATAATRLGVAVGYISGLLLLLGADLSALRGVGSEQVTAVIVVPVAERLGFSLLDVEAERAKHGKRCDGKESGTHFLSKRRPGFLFGW